MTIALGAVQVFFGVLIAAYESIRRGDPAQAVFVQLSTIFFFAMLAVAFLVPGAWRWALPVGIGITMLAQGRAFEAGFRVAGVGPIDRGWYVFWLLAAFATLVALPLGYWQVALAFVAVSIVAAIVSKTARTGVFGFLGGAYSVYGMTSFVGDVLSYTRLAALGLAGVLVGTVFNLLAGLLLDPATGVMSRGTVWWFVGAVIFVLAMLVFVVGHTFNVLINLIGAFVHPARLQYVEFFSKFYKAGGSMFDPFGLQAKQLVLTAGESGRKGGPTS